MPEWLVTTNMAVTMTIAPVALFIAWLQWHLAKNKLKLDLFDRRNAIYGAVSKHIAWIIREARADYRMNLEFYRETAGAEFLFDDEIAALIKETYEQSNLLAGVITRLEDGAPEDERERLNGEKTRILEWMVNRPELLKRKFAPFLSISHRPFPSGLKIPR